MEDRETPMDMLRRLAGALAPSSKPFVSSSPAQHRRSGFTKTPNWNIDGSSDSVPPLSSRLEDDNFAIRFPQPPLGALSSQAGRVSGSSLEACGDNDALDTNELTGDIDQQPDFFTDTFLKNIHAQAEAGDGRTRHGIEVDSCSGTIGRSDSEFGQQVLASVDETTFMSSDPSAHGSGTSPFVVSFAETGVDNVATEGSREDRTLSIPPTAASGDDGGDDGMHNDSEPKQSFAADNDDDEQWPSEEHVKPSSAQRPAKKLSKRKRRPRRISKHGREYPTLAPTLVKRVAQTALQSSGLSNTRVSPDTLTALTRASEWFFEQLGGDLGAYANHAGRKTIQEGDVVLLMKRQNQITPDNTLFSLAQRYLPRELVQELRMPVPLGGTLRNRSREEQATDTSSEISQASALQAPEGAFLSSLSTTITNTP